MKNPSQIFDIFACTYHVYWCFVGATIAIFDSGILAAFYFGQLDIDLAWGTHSKERTLNELDNRVSASFEDLQAFLLFFRINYNNKLL